MTNLWNLDDDKRIVKKQMTIRFLLSFCLYILIHRSRKVELSVHSTRQKFVIELPRRDLFFPSF